MRYLRRVNIVAVHQNPQTQAVDPSSPGRLRRAGPSSPRRLPPTRPSYAHRSGLREGGSRFLLRLKSFRLRQGYAGQVGGQVGEMSAGIRSRRKRVANVKFISLPTGLALPEKNSEIWQRADWRLNLWLPFSTTDFSVRQKRFSCGQRSWRRW